MSDNNRGTNEHSVTVGLPVVYRLVGPNDEFGGLFASATAAAEVGRRAWPDTPQYADCDGIGAFWDVEVVEAG